MSLTDAEDAVKGRDGYSFDGQRLRCEMAKGDRGGGGGARGGTGSRVKIVFIWSSSRNKFSSAMISFGCIKDLFPLKSIVGRDERSRGATGGRRTEYGVVVSNLPKSCSWQVFNFAGPHLFNIMKFCWFLMIGHSELAIIILMTSNFIIILCFNKCIWPFQ